jgi:hypothetical protein
MQHRTFLAAAAMLAGCGGAPSTDVQSITLQLTGGATPRLAVYWTTTALPSPRLSVFGVAGATTDPLLQTRLDGRFFGPMVGLLGGRSPQVLFRSAVDPTELYGLGLDQRAAVFAGRPALLTAVSTDYVGADGDAVVGLRDDGQERWRVALDQPCANETAAALCVSPGETAIGVVQRAPGPCSSHRWRFVTLPADGTAQRAATVTSDTAWDDALPLCALDDAGRALVALTHRSGSPADLGAGTLLWSTAGDGTPHARAVAYTGAAGVASLSEGWLLAALHLSRQSGDAFAELHAQRLGADLAVARDDGLGVLRPDRVALVPTPAGPVLAYAPGESLSVELHVRGYDGHGDEQRHVAVDLGGLWDAAPMP